MLYFTSEIRLFLDIVFDTPEVEMKYEKKGLKL